MHVEPQVFDVLTYLIEHRDRVVTKSELLESVWGHDFVSESALTTRVKQLRQAVGDTGRDQRIVQTVHGRGYRFIAPVEEVPGDAERPHLAVPPDLRQDIHFCTASDGTRIAYATVGTGPPLVRAALDHPSRLRLAEPGLAPLARRPRPGAPVHPLRRAGLRVVGARRRRLLARRLRAGPRSRRRRPRPGAVPVARCVPGRRDGDHLRGPSSGAGQPSDPARRLRQGRLRRAVTDEQREPRSSSRSCASAGVGRTRPSGASSPRRSSPTLRRTCGSPSPNCSGARRRPRTRRRCSRRGP